MALLSPACFPLFPIESTAYDIVFSEIDEFAYLTSEQKQETKENLVKDLESLNKHEKAAETQRFKKLWVQSTQISDKIAKNSRKSEAIISSINHTISSFAENEIYGNLKRLARQYSETVQDICEQELDILTGTDITCSQTETSNKYRSINGVCNNLKNKHFGAAGIAMRRFETPAYENGELVVIFMFLYLLF